MCVHVSALSLSFWGALRWHSPTPVCPQREVPSFADPVAVWLHWSRLCLCASSWPWELPATPEASRLPWLPAASAEDVFTPLTPPSSPPWIWLCVSARPLHLCHSALSCGGPILPPSLKTKADTEDKQFLSAPVSRRKLFYGCPLIWSPATSLPLPLFPQPFIPSSWASVIDNLVCYLFHLTIQLRIKKAGLLLKKEITKLASVTLPSPCPG